jgi:hypothetical protein
MSDRKTTRRLSANRRGERLLESVLADLDRLVGTS